MLRMQINMLTGAVHDCCESASSQCGDFPSCSTSSGAGNHPCWPSPSKGGTFLMFPTIMNVGNRAEAHPNIERLSPCSINDIRSVVALRGTCLLEDDACLGSDCCDTDGNVYGSDILCQPADPFDPCLEDSYCTGMDGHCPTHSYRPNGAACLVFATQPFIGLCFDGICRTYHHDACRSHGLDACILPEQECIVACMVEGMRCIALSSACNLFPYWRVMDTCLQHAENAPCIQVNTNGASHSSNTHLVVGQVCAYWYILLSIMMSKYPSNFRLGNTPILFWNERILCYLPKRS